MISTRNSFDNREALAVALSDRVSRALSRAVTRQGHAVLAVSGGTTPALFFERLSLENVTWEKITVTLVDERQVLESNARSNARLVKQNLLRNHAARAKFVPLFENEAEAKSLTLDVVVLGMGEDGHTASFFPGGDRLQQALEPGAADGVLPMNAPGAGEPRLTYTLDALLKAKVICLHVEGAKKKTVLDKAEAGTDALEMPIRAVLQSGNPVEIFWCP